MAAAAMADPIHDSVAAVPLARLVGIGMDRRAIKEQRVPEKQERTNARRKEQPVWQRRVMHRLQRTEPRKQSVRIVMVQLGEIRIGKSGIKMSAVRCDPLPQRAIKIVARPVSDSRLRVWRDVRRINSAHPGMQRITACIRLSALARAASRTLSRRGAEARVRARPSDLPPVTGSHAASRAVWSERVRPQGPGTRERRRQVRLAARAIARKFFARATAEIVVGGAAPRDSSGTTPSN